jgi:putative transposase
MIRTYKYRLYPRNAQKRTLDFLLWQGRKLYNAALEQRINAYQETGKAVSYVEQWAHFRDERHANPDTLGQLNATCVQQMLRRLDKAFKAFFRRVKAGETPGFPRFKGRYRFHSLEFRHGDGCKLRFDDQGRALFYVQNAGEIKVKYHRPLPDDATIKHVVVKRKDNKWYVCLQVDLNRSDELPNPESVAVGGPAVGIDMGLESLLALSDGTLIENPRWLRRSQRKLRVAQRRLSRRQKGSKRRRKAAGQVARLHERISNQRRDFWHKLTRNLVDTYGLIGLEDLTLDFMTRNHHLALSAHDAGLGEFQQLLRYKAEEAGIEVVTVNPRNTSQTCSGCGVIVKKGLSVRVHCCPHCGLELNRDVNAARNVLTLALNAARTERSEPNVDQRVERALRSRRL